MTAILYSADDWLFVTGAANHNSIHHSSTPEEAKTDLSSFSFRADKLTDNDVRGPQDLIESVQVPQELCNSIDKAEQALLRYIVGEAGPDPIAGLGGDYRTAFSMLDKWKDLLGDNSIAKVLQSYLHSIEHAPIGKQSGLSSELATKRLSTYPRIDDGADFARNLTRLLRSVNRCVLCTSCGAPSIVDWFRDRLRFRHTVSLGGKLTTHAYASLIPTIRVVAVMGIDGEGINSPS